MDSLDQTTSCSILTLLLRTLILRTNRLDTDRIQIFPLDSDYPWKDILPNVHRDAIYSLLWHLCLLRFKGDTLLAYSSTTWNAKVAARSYDNQWVTMEYSVANNRRVLHANQHMTGGLNGSRKYISTNALRNERERHEKNIQYQSRTEPTSIRAKLIIRRAHKDPFQIGRASCRERVC